MSNKVSIITDNGPDFLANIRVKELIGLALYYTEDRVFSFDFNEIKNDQTRNVLIFAFLHLMTSVTYSLKYWLVFHNHGADSESEDFKQALVQYESMVAISDKFHEKYTGELNLKKLTDFMVILTQMGEQTIDFDMAGLNNDGVTFLYLFFKLNYPFFTLIDNDALRSLTDVSAFAGIYVIVQFWQKNDQPSAGFNILNDQNILDSTRRSFNDANVRAILVDILNINSHINDPVFGEAAMKLQVSMNFEYSDNSTLRKLAILSDRTMVNIMVERLQAIENPDKSQKQALVRYLFLQDQISAKRYKKIFTPENIDWYKAWILENLLAPTAEVDSKLPADIAAYEFLSKKFNTDIDPFLPRLVRNVNMQLFNFADAPNILIYKRIYDAMCHRELSLREGGAKAPFSTVDHENLQNMRTSMDITKINIIEVRAFLKYMRM